jgi:N-acetylglucosamine kinase-like BadF-type ATPase
VGVILGVDGGNSKTELVAASTDGEVLARVRGGGSNSHAAGGAERTAAVVAGLAAEAGVAAPAELGAFFLCGADVPADIAELEAALDRRALVRRALVDNDTFALLRAGTDRADAVAIVCGSGINVVGRAASGRTARYPSLGWETGDWGGSEMLGREVLFEAARAEDGRAKPTALVAIVSSHFGLSVAEVGEAVHYRRVRPERLGELAPAVVAAAATDATARRFVERLASEIALMAARALRDLGVDEADVVLGGGMLQAGEGPLHEAVLARLPAGARPVVLRDAPVVGAALAALDAAGATGPAKARLREALRAG